MDQTTLTHLEFIQSNISRMNQCSFMIKGWTITIISALLALFAASKGNGQTGNTVYIFVAIVPTFIFWYLDSYYLQQERIFRGIYNAVINPSDLFVSQNRSNISGVIVAPIMQGSRCILTELQALVTQSFLEVPRRVVAGVDFNKLNLILAVLEKHAGMKFYNRDVFTNVAGGMKLNEPGGDLGLAAALIASFHDRPIPPDIMPIGEITLAGEIRPVAQISRRIAEGKRFGFKRFIVAQETDLSDEKGILRVKTIRDAIKAIFD